MKSTSWLSFECVKKLHPDFIVPKNAMVKWHNGVLRVATKTDPTQNPFYKVSGKKWTIAKCL